MKIKLGSLYKSTRISDLTVVVTEITVSETNSWVYAIHAYDDTWYTETDAIHNGGRRGRWQKEHFERCFIPYINVNQIWKDLNK